MMKTHNVEQGTQAWLELRASHYTASEAAAMMGFSKYTSRQKLLAEKATGIRDEITPRQQAIFDKGHAAEAGARPIIENKIGEDLYPVVATEGDLLASFDGLTMDDCIVFEHKLWNQKLVARVNADIESGTGLEAHYYYQLEQQLYIAGADKAIFVCSDGTAENMVVCWYVSIPERLEALLDGWEQFKKDLAEYKPVEHKPELKGVALLELPALIVQIAGEVKSSNLPAFRDTALARIESINTNLQTDQDFADAEANVKFFAKAEKELEAAKKQAMAQTIDIDTLFRTVDQLKETMRSKRLELDKLVKARKLAIKQEIILAAQTQISEHVLEVNAQLPINLPSVDCDFAKAIKGKSSLKSIRESVADAIAAAKIEVARDSKRVEENYGLIVTECNGRPYEFLFRDLGQILMMDPQHFTLLIKDRINQHEAQEAARLEQERARIRQEEERRAEERARIRQEEERKAQEALERKAEAERQRIYQEDQRMELEARRAAQEEEARLEREESSRLKHQAVHVKPVFEKEQREIVTPNNGSVILTQDPKHKHTINEIPYMNVREPEITIPVSEYEKLMADAFLLHCLKGNGVDNWVGWDQSMADYHEQHPEL